MKLLLDTPAYLFAIDQTDLLGHAARELLEDPKVERWISLVCFWEIAIKVQLGKLDVPLNREFHAERLAELRARVLPIEFDHVLAVGQLPPHHRDPFDRMLIAQSIAEKLTLVTRDAQFTAYGAPTVW